MEDINSTKSTVLNRTIGRVFINIVSGQNLQPPRPHEHLPITHNPTPYCRISVHKRRYKTKSKHDLSPEWNEGPFIFDNVENIDQVKIEIRDKVTIGHGHFFGEAYVAVANLPNEQMTRFEVPLTNHKNPVTGTLTIEARYEPELNQVRRRSIDYSNRTSLGDTSSELSSVSSYTSPPPRVDFSSPVTPIQEKQAIVSTIVPLPTAANPTTSTTTVVNTVEVPEGTVVPASIVETITAVAEGSEVYTTNSSDSFTSGRSDSNRVSFSDLNEGNDSDGKDSKERMSKFRRSKIVRAMKNSPSFKQERVDKKNASYRKLFNVPEEETLVYDCASALSRTMLHHGRLYFSQNYICFYSNLFGIKVIETIKASDIKAVRKENKVLVNPGISITTRDENEYHFASFLSREKTYRRILMMCKSSDLSADPENSSEDLEEESYQEEESLDEEKDIEDELSIVLSTEEDKESNFLQQKDKLQELSSFELPISVVKYFSMFYSDESDFVQKYHDERGDKDLTIEKWNTNSPYGTMRTLNYTAPVKAAIGPSRTRLEETQRYHLQRERLVVENVSIMHDIPYGDYFRVESKHEIVAVAEDKCKVTASVGVNFIKKTFFEGKIRSGVLRESGNGFEMWIRLAREEINKRKKMIVRKNSLMTSSTEVSPPPSPPTQAPAAAAVPPPIPIKPTVAISERLTTLSSRVIGMVKEEQRMQLIGFIVLFLLLLFLVIQVIVLSNRVARLESRLEDLLIIVSKPTGAVILK